MPVDRDLQRLPGVPVPTVFFVPHLSNATPPPSLSPSFSSGRPQTTPILGILNLLAGTWHMAKTSLLITESYAPPGPELSCPVPGDPVAAVS